MPSWWVSSATPISRGIKSVDRFQARNGVRADCCPANERERERGRGGGGGGEREREQGERE